MADVRCPARLVDSGGDRRCQLWSPAGVEGRHVGPHSHDGTLWANLNELEGGIASVSLEASAREQQVGGDHYRKFAIQPWDVIDEYDLDYYRGNVVKYVLRADHKGAKLEDLKKARQYLDRAIEIEEGKEGDEPKPAWP